MQNSTFETGLSGTNKVKPKEKNRFARKRSLVENRLKAERELKYMIVNRYISATNKHKNVETIEVYLIANNIHIYKSNKPIDFERIFNIFFPKYIIVWF